MYRSGSISLSTNCCWYRMIWNHLLRVLGIVVACNKKGVVGKMVPPEAQPRGVQLIGASAGKVASDGKIFKEMIKLRVMQ